MTNKVTIDAPPVSEEDATFLMLYHLQLASAYFEAIPLDIEPILEKIQQTFPELQDSAAKVWLTNMHNAYEEASK